MDAQVPQEVLANLAVDEELVDTSAILGAIIWIDPHGDITRANQPALRFLGCAVEKEVTGNFYSRFFKVLHLGTELGAHTCDGDAVIKSLIMEGSAVSVFGCAHGIDRVVRPFEGVLITIHAGHGEAAGVALAIQSVDS